MLISAMALYIGSNLFVKAYQVHAGVNKLQMNMYNTISAITVFLLLFCLKGFSLSWNSTTVLLEALCGVILCVYYSAKVLSISEGPIALVTMSFVLGGVLMPAVYGFVLLGDPVTWVRILGLVMVCLSFVPTIIDQHNIKSSAQKLSPRFFVYCVLLFVLNGLICCLSKAAQLSSPDPSWSMDFVALYYLFYFFVSLVPLTAQSKHYTVPDMQSTFSLRGFFFMAMSGACGALAAVLNFSLGFRMPASVQFPVIQSSIMVGVTLSSIILFREKPRISTIFSMAIAIIAIILLSI